MNVYHMTYEPSFRILDLHFWGCNLNCLGCYKNYEIHDLGLNGKSVERLATAAKAEPPSHFYTLEQVLEKTWGLNPKFTIFMGKEAALDPELPVLAAALHAQTGGYHILLTNGLKVPELSNIDEVVFSFKAYNGGIHRKYTGQTNDQILSNFRHYYLTGKRVQAEIAYIPGLVEESDIEDLAKFIAGIDVNIPFRVTSYFEVPSAPWESATRDQVNSAAKVAGQYLKNMETVTSDETNEQWKPVVVF